MNVLYFLDSYPKLSLSFVTNEVRSLRERGHDVAVFALVNPGEDASQPPDVPIGHASRPTPGDVTDLLRGAVLDHRVLREASFAAGPLRHLGALHRAQQCIDFVDHLGFDVDVVHSHFATLRTFPGQYVAANYDVPRTLTTHAFDLYADPDLRKLDHYIDRADHVVTVSEYNREFIETTIGPSTPVSVVHAGIRPDEFDPQPERRADSRVLTVARLVEKKGLPDALRAIVRVRDAVPNVEYHVIGDGPLRSELEALIAEYRLGGTVELLGPVSDERLRREYAEASCFLLPSVISESGDRDGIPVVLMEAMATGTPPVTTAVSGIPELVDHDENGLLVSPGEPRDLAGAVVRLLGDSDLIRRLGRAGRETVVAEFDATTEATKLESIFREHVETEGRAGGC